jgi:hypothetical protein
MKRSMCGLVVLAAATVLWSCNGDPTENLIREGERITADPTSVFVNHGGSEFVVVGMVDNQGNQLTVDFTPQNVGPGITVERDTTFLQTTIGTTLETRQRFIVTGVTPTATSFELVSGGQTITIPVKVTPIGTTVTLSNAAPAMNEPLTVTLPEGFKFGTAPGVTVGADVGITTAVAPDSTSVTVILPPGTTGTVTVDSVQAAHIPGVNLALPTEQTVTVGATPLAGTDDPSTAPILPLPAPGGIAPTFDVPDFASSGFFRFYRIDVAEPGSYTVSLDWDIGSDMDLYLCFDLACDEGDFAAAGAAHPEVGEYNIVTPGTYWLWVNDYAGDAAGATISLVITRPS